MRRMSEDILALIAFYDFISAIPFPLIEPVLVVKIKALTKMTKIRIILVLKLLLILRKLRSHFEHTWKHSLQQRQWLGGTNSLKLFKFSKFSLLFKGR